MKVRQVISVALVGCARAWGGWVIVATIQSDDVPPIAVIFAMIPAIALLLFAAAIPPSRRPDGMRGFEVITKVGDE